MLLQPFPQTAPPLIQSAYKPAVKRGGYREFIKFLCGQGDFVESTAAIWYNIRIV